MKVTLFRKPRVAVTFSCLLAFAGCATISPSKVVENSYIADGPSEEVATVNFIRVVSFWGGGVAVPVYLNSELAMKLRTETYTTLPLEPGRYEIVIGKDNVKLPGGDPAKRYNGTLIFSPGETYFLLLYQEQYGVLTGQFGIELPAYWIKFDLIEIDDANERMSRYELISLNSD